MTTINQPASISENVIKLLQSPNYNDVLIGLSFIDSIDSFELFNYQPSVYIYKQHELKLNDNIYCGIVKNEFCLYVNGCYGLFAVDRKHNSKIHRYYRDIINLTESDPTFYKDFRQ